MTKLAVWTLKTSSDDLAVKIAEEFHGTVARVDREAIKDKFHRYDAHVFIMSTGIVVRLIADLIESKTTDPAVIVVDSCGLHAISLLSGHLGGANELTRRIAKAVGAIPVITTATDLKGKVAFDEAARIIGGKVINPEMIKVTSSSLLENKKVGISGYREIYEAFYADCPNVVYIGELPESAGDFSAFATFTDSLPHISSEIRDRTLVVAVPTLAAGIGCHIGIRCTEILAGIRSVIERNNLLMESIFVLASVDAKKDEEGLLEASRKLGVPITFFSAKELSEKGEFLSPPSGYVEKHVGVKGVAEPAAFLAAGAGSKIIVQKQKLENMTVAVARRPLNTPKKTNGKIYAVGLGPGDLSQMTVRARQVLSEVDTIVGYKTYINLIRPLTSGKNVITTGMTREVERCKRAIKEARKGSNVAVVSSGDSGIYGMAGLLYELIGGSDEIEIEVIPGVTASTAAAAVAGAPLMCDYISLSLSDLLQPTDEVKRRIRVAAGSDMVTVLYNPKSKRRTELIEYTRDEFLKHRAPETPVAIVSNTYRKNETLEICQLSDFIDREISMTSLVIIGNSQSEIIGGKMITRRGYQVK